MRLAKRFDTKSIKISRKKNFQISVMYEVFPVGLILCFVVMIFKSGGKLPTSIYSFRKKSLVSSPFSNLWQGEEHPAPQSGGALIGLRNTAGINI